MTLQKEPKYLQKIATSDLWHISTSNRATLMEIVHLRQLHFLEGISVMNFE